MNPLIRSVISKSYSPMGKFSVSISRSFHSMIPNRSLGDFQPTSTPSPPKLPEEDQEEFERLQKVANSQVIIEEYNNEGNPDAAYSKSNPNIKETTDIGNFPSYFATIPEFEGDVNPKTGEVGGPKQDPLRHGDYSFNGRVTDF
ncbi:Sdh8 protein [Saccharomycopsis crataegensis]|uniref:Succinate dehydrogenase assembly factor 4, mitochondrial n=1 Tax=Saccharomycopsis crataegensis TaxID=43959 RepID=A0AAV5QVI5_9ASCO|nr:Sdh8 protein [Saccharomycopsis crataegensis]